MTTEESAFQLDLRRRMVAFIIQRAHMYKVCDQCRSLVPKSTAHCPFCATYRFDDDPDYVIATANEMSGNAVAVGAPVVPRIARNQQSCGEMTLPITGPRA